MHKLGITTVVGKLTKDVLKPVAFLIITLPAIPSGLSRKVE